MENKRKAKCRNCGADVFWFVTKNYKNIPVDANTVNEEEIRQMEQFNEKLQYDFTRHMTHFKTCEQAELFKRNR